MATEKTVQEIASRFGADRLEIVQYVNFIRDQCAIHEQEVVRLNDILTQYGLPELPTRDFLDTNHHLTPAEIGNLVRQSNRVTPAIDRIISDLNPIMDCIPVAPAEAVFEHPDLLAEWTDYAMEHLPDDPRAERYQTDEEALLAGAGSDNVHEDGLSTANRQVIVNEALRRARATKARNMCNALQYALDRFSTIKTVGKLVEPNAVADILRQGFVLLITAFDAAIFDLVRVKLRKDFFKLIGALGKNEKVTFQDMAEAGDIEALQNDIIEEQLKRRYIKDLLGLLASEWNVQCVEPGQKFERLIELVLRRNVHIHNRGIVDERYLDEKKNLDRLKLGDIAFISEAYWQIANEFCCVCVRNVAAWAAE